MAKKKREDKSITWIVGAVMIVVAVFGWACLASAYADAHAPVPTDELESPRMPAGRGAALAMAISGTLTFAANAITQLPSLPFVIGWSLMNRIGIIVGIIVVEAIVIGGGFGLKSLEKQLEQPYRPKR